MSRKPSADARRAGRLSHLRGLALVATAFLLAAVSAQAGGPPPEWMTRPLRDYNESPTAAPPSAVTHPPARYTITITVLQANSAATHKVDPPAADEAQIMAHLPESARLWIADEATTQQGMVRYFSSPPLKPGKKYHYAARVVWFEGGKWVSQNRKLPVWAGRTTCLYLSRPSAVASSLGELSPADRVRATAQKYCPVQPENLLGSMGKPFKVTLEGRPVFLCCEECAEQARANPGRTVAKAKELESKHGAKPRK